MTLRDREKFAEGKAEGKAEGRAEGELNILRKLVSQGLLTVKEAADSINVTVEEFERRCEN